MSSASASNIIISEDTPSEQEEIRKASRMTLKEVQNVVSTLKENLHPRKPLSHAPVKDLVASTGKQQQQQQQPQQQHQLQQPSEPKRSKMVEQLSKATQTTFDEEQNLTGKQPTDGYWEKVAEKRRLALEETLDENARLHMEVGELKEELDAAHNVKESLQSLVDTLMEMLNEHETEGKSADGSSGAGPSGSGKVDDSGIAHSLVGEAAEDF
uniref:Geminin n=1 Tax=Anopheles epiroticus TaxID=199890 RepID=A0A182PFW5_9DIPT